MQVIGSGLPPRPGRLSRRRRPGSQGPHLSGSAQRARQGPAAVPVVPANPRGSLKGPSPLQGRGGRGTVPQSTWVRRVAQRPLTPHLPVAARGGGDVHARLALETPHRHCLEPASGPAPPPPLGSPPALRQRPAQPLPGPTPPSRSWRAQSLQSSEGPLGAGARRREQLRGHPIRDKGVPAGAGPGKHALCHGDERGTARADDPRVREAAAAALGGGGERRGGWGPVICAGAAS